MLLRRWGVGSTVSLTLPRRVAKFCLLRIISLGWMYTCRHAILLVLEDVKLLAKSCCFGGGASGRRSLSLYPGGSPSFVCFESLFCSRGLYGANQKPLLESTARRQQGPIGSNSETFIREHSMCWMCTYRHAILLVLVNGQVVLLRRWGVGSTVSLTLPRRVAKFCLIRIIFCVAGQTGNLY